MDKWSTLRRPSSALCAASFAVAILAGCNTPPDRQQQQAGAIVGAIVGGVIGHQVGGGAGRDIATAAGVIAGTLVGGALGRSMDDNDRLRAAHALEASPTGTPSVWVNPDTGRSFSVVPTRTWSAAQGPCREYTVDSAIGGRPEKVYGTACRQADGSWRAIN